MPYLNRYAIAASVLVILVLVFSGSMPLHAQNQFSISQPQFVIVANAGSNDVSVYAINPNSGALTQVEGSPFATGPQPVTVAIDPKGKFAYVANQNYPSGQGSVSVYSINPASGVLAQVEGSPFGDAYGEPYGAAVTPSGQFFYTPNVYSGDVSAYAIDATSGALSPISGYFWAEGEPEGIAVDPTGKFAYTSNSESNDVSGFTINSTSGVLTPVQGSPFTTGGSTPGGQEPVAFDPAGRFAYFNNINSSSIAVIAINPTSGALTPVPGSPFQDLEGGSFGVTVDPSGRFAYVANGVGGNVSAFAIDAVSGALTPVEGSPFAAGAYVVCVVVDPTGRFAYATNIQSNTVSAFSIAKNGALKPVVGSPFATGSEPFGLAVTPVRGSGPRR